MSVKGVEVVKGVKGVEGVELLRSRAEQHLRRCRKQKELIAFDDLADRG
jgi:hypothetical protein